MIFRSPYADITIPDTPLTPLLLRHAELLAEKPALIDDTTKRVYTYGELATTVRNLAGNLARRDGFVKNLATGAARGLAASELSDDRHESARLSVRFNPTDTIQDELMVGRFTEYDQPRQAIAVVLRPRYLYPTFLGFSVPVDYALAGVSPSPDWRHVAVGPMPTFNKARIWDVTNTTTVNLSSNLAARLALGWEDAHLDTFENNGATTVLAVDGRTQDRLRQYTVEPSVDYVGVDGYVRFPCVQWDGRPFLTFKQTFQEAYDFAQGLGKPLFIGEVGIIEQDSCGYAGDPNAKAEWVAQGLAQMRAWPGVIAICWSHVIVNFLDQHVLDYHVDSTPQAFDAFMQGVDDRYFQRPPPT